MKNKFVIALILAFMTSFASVYPALAAEPEFASVTVNVEGQTAVPENSGDDSPEDLFEQYMSAVFGLPGNRSMRKSRKSTGTRLKGNDLAVYQAVASELPDIAAGERGPTAFELTLDVFGVEAEWTADELGVSSIVVEDGQGNVSIAQDAYAAANAKISFDLDKVLTALLADYPYELYWFDKKTGAEVSEYQLNGTNSNGEWKIILPKSITLCFSVSDDFSEGEYLVNTEIGQSVQDAVNNANAIIERYSGASDEDKLSGYKNAICDLADYNNEAAGGNGYGNPWQLLWVFDNDENTKVVCEGYSKAFKYLCDQSSFDADITCILVTGTMSGGTGAGPHMWNIVKMGDGLNYLADVTNCDDGSIGFPNKLFLTRTEELDSDGEIETGYTFHLASGNITYTYDEDTLNYYRQDELSLGEICQHNLVNTPAKDATCTEAGNIEYWTCSECGKRYSDAGGTTEITAEDTAVAAKGHNLTRTEAKAATCTEAGNIEYWTCSRCEKLFSDKAGKTEINLADTVIAASHNLTRTEAKAATCTEAGNIGYWTCSRCGKRYSDAGGTTEITAEDTAVAAKGHTLTRTEAKAVTCTEAGNIEFWTCSSCGKLFSNAAGTKAITKNAVEVAANGHSWSGWTVTKKATCTETGSRERSCSVCGEKAAETYTLTAEEKAAEEAKQKQKKEADEKAAEEQRKAREAAEAQATKKKADTAAANSTIKQIDNVPAAAKITLADKAGIDTAVKAYDALSADQKKLIPAETVKKLEDAKKKLAELEAEAAAEEAAGHKTVEAATKTMAALSDNADPANSDYGTLALKAKKITNKSIKLQWNKVKDASGYIIYANKCGKTIKYQLVADIKGASKKSFTLNKIQSGALKKNTYYKVIVAAYKVTKGGEQRVISTSKSIHVATVGGKNGNPGKLTLSKKKVTKTSHTEKVC